MSPNVKVLTNQGIQIVIMSYGHLMMADMVTQTANVSWVNKSHISEESKTLSASMARSLKEV
jgi:hypothetical protein